ncbi:TPA: hypothetical protein PXP42_003661 [Yersinia enterocolitica]|nr:hypothetical protein [Yersinia enterocolitica]
MTRLNQSMRKKIVDNAVNKALTERKATLKSTYDKWVEDVRVLTIGGKEKEDEYLKIAEKINKLEKMIPEQFRDNKFELAKNYYIHLNIGGSCFMIDSGSERIICANTDRHNGRFVIQADNSLAIRWTENEAEKARIDGLEKTIRVNAEAVVNSVSSVKKLMEVWPECAELLPKEIERQIINLPTVQIDQLNTMIGIPTQA